MKLSKAQKILRKIHALIDNMEGNGEALMPMERDLMLHYLRQLYDLFLQAEVNPENAHEPFGKSANAPGTPPKTAPGKKTAAPKPKATLPPKPDPQPEPPAPEPPQEVEAELKPAAPKPKPRPVPKPPKPAAISEDLQELFELPVAKELSEKLSTLPISDLSKAMGLNERIFTIKELFGDDQELFNKTLNRLNKLTSFEEAETVLVEIAKRFEWTDKKKRKKAKNFIKLVSRRYK